MSNLKISNASNSAALTTATKPLVNSVANDIKSSVKAVGAQLLPVVISNSSSFVSTDTFITQRPIETTFASNNSNPTIALTKAYTKGFELAADTGSKSISGTQANSVSETISLKKGVAYTLNSAFGLSNTKGNVKLDIKDSNGTSIKSMLGTVGKTSIATTFTPTADGVYSINLTGQPIAATKTSAASTTNLYQSYQIQVLQALSVLPKTSGNTNVDALVLGGTNAWQHAVGSTASASANVIDGTLNSLNNVVDNSNTISYSFMDSAFLKTLTGKDQSSPSVMDDTTKAAVVTAFDYLSSLVNVKFTQANSISDATIVFGENNQGNVSAGYANPPNQSGSHQQFLFLANDAATNDSTKNNGFATGTYGWQTVIHEIAHTMGLKHPFNGNAGGGGTPGPYLPTATNNHRYSIMSYTSASDSKALTTTVKGGNVSLSPTQVNPSTYMTYDIEALQYLYGANTSISSSDSKLSSIQNLNFTDAYKGMETLWTPNGGTLDASNTTHKNIIDLRGGAYSSINYLGTGASQVTQSLAAGGITNSTSVASVLKTFNSTITTAYTGNNNVALAYGSKITTAEGGKGDDAFYVSNYNSSLVGGDGTDTVYLYGKNTDWTVSDNSKLSSNGGNLSSSVTLTNKTTKAAFNLSGIEKYAFYAAGSAITKA
jgi:serralysin